MMNLNGDSKISITIMDRYSYLRQEGEAESALGWKEKGKLIKARDDQGCKSRFNIPTDWLFSIQSPRDLSWDY